MAQAVDLGTRNDRSFATDLDIDMTCDHLNAFPSLDHARFGGWYCRDCKSGCERPSRFAPPPGKQLIPPPPPPITDSSPFRAPQFLKQNVSASNTNTLLAETLAPGAEKTPPHDAIYTEIDELPDEIYRKTSASTSEGAQEWQGLYRYPSKGRKYYRYMSGKGDSITHCIHIPGGSTSNSRATGRAEQVKRWMLQGVKAETIAAKIKTWV